MELGVFLVTQHTEPEVPSRSRARHIVTRVFKIAVPAAAIACIAGIVVRLTVRDSFDVLAIIFYSLPPVVIAALAFVVGTRLGFRKRRISCLFFLFTSVSCLIWWHQTSFVHNQSQAAEHSIRVLFWNVARGRGGWSPLLNEIRRTDADVIGLVEAGRQRDKLQSFYEARFPDYNTVALGKGMALLTRGDVIAIKHGELGQGSRYARLRLKLSGKQMTVVLVDVKSNPFISRREAFNSLYEIISNSDDEPLLLMGDFNTPSDSVFYETIRHGFVNAFETAGNGLSATWPVPLPVLDLDQVWTNRKISVQSCTLGWLLQCDHRPVVTDLSIVPEKSEK